MPRSCIAGPNIASADRIIQDMRTVKMGTLIPAGRDAPLKLAEALQRGQHVAMLVDQYLTNGVEGDVLRPQDQGQSDRWRGCCARSNARSMASASSACPTIASAPKYQKK